MASLRLVTIGFSHFCEKARWALDRAGLDYVEDDHAPLLHYSQTFRLGVGRLVPVLVTPGGVIRESSAIVRFADEALPEGRRLFPVEPEGRAEVEALVAEYDRTLGPAVRRAIYHLVLDDAAGAKDLLASAGPPWERRATRRFFRPIRALMKRGLNITPEASARSFTKVEAVFAAVEARLAGGRRYLVGDRFTAADLTFASLSGPALAPEQYGFPLPLERMPAAARAWVERMRETPAGRFALRIYAEERPPVRAQGRSDGA